VVESPAPAPPPPPPAEVSYQTFYDELSPYGNWINYPGYGYVWMPNTGPGFKPYATNGHWVYTDAGWTWNSGFSWGWAPFHYGRWFFDQSYGWMWIPGYEWSPAWVSWRTNSDYYGWAPLSPGVSVNIAFSSYNPPTNYWCFVPHQYVTSPSINNYYVNETKNVTIIHNTTIINNNVTVNNYNNTNISNRTNVTVNNGGRNAGYTAGPDPNEVGRYTGAEVHPVALRASNRPGGSQVSNGQMNIYRPAVNNAPASTGSTAQQTMAPSRVQSLRDLHPNNGNGQGNGGNPREENGNAYGAQENGRSNDNGNNYGNRNLPGNGRTSGGTNREEEGNANGARENNHSGDNGNNAGNQQSYGRSPYTPGSNPQSTPNGNMPNNPNNGNMYRGVNPAQNNQPASPNNQATQGSRVPQNGNNANAGQNNNSNAQGQASQNRQPSGTAITGYQNGRGGQGYKPPVNNPGNGNGQRANGGNQHPAGNGQAQARNNGSNHQQQNPNKKPENNSHSN